MFTWVSVYVMAGNDGLTVAEATFVQPFASVMVTL